MIKNAREYQITKAQAAKFERALDVGDTAEAASALRQVERNALRCQLDDLRAELDEYDSLQSGRLRVLEVDDLSGLPRALIRGRIAARLSQRELADRLDLKEQQVQRYEATEYASASLTRILEVVAALGLKLRQDIVLPTVDVSSKAVVDLLARCGFDKRFVESRLLIDDDDESGWRTAGAAARVLGLSPARLFIDAPNLGDAAAQAAFKLPTNVSETRLPAYATYAKYLAERTLIATALHPVIALPDRPRDVHQALKTRYGGVTFAAALQFVWDLGIPVLPLRDVGGFHGAFWKINGRGVIVLKQNVVWTARWLIDLLHEYYHAVEACDLNDAEILEHGESPFDRGNSSPERTATAWAIAAALNEREEELAQMTVDDAGGSVPRFQRSVVRIASQAGVPADVLANYIAHKLARHEQADWWGAATNLQASGVSPWQLARDVLLERVELNRLDRVDRDLLTRALMEEE